MMAAERQALDAVKRAIAALTVDEIEEVIAEGSTRAGERVPLLHRSIAPELILIERALGGAPTLLGCTAASIDEALLALAEAEVLLCGADRDRQGAGREQ